MAVLKLFVSLAALKSSTTSLRRPPVPIDLVEREER
jgi:hypothetical protein